MTQGKGYAVDAAEGRASRKHRGLGLGISAAAGAVGLAGVAAGLTLAQAGQALASDAGAQLGPRTEAVAASAMQVLGDLVEEPAVVGTFSFSQNVVTPTATIAKTLGKGVDTVLCSGGATETTSDEMPASDAGVWEITVSGDGVDDAFTATVDELARDGAQTRILGCTCAGNPADGRATANAQCTGVAVSSLLDLAGLREGANTITFVSSDGYEVALPLDYVLQRASMIVYQVNGEPLAKSMGGTTQLWLGSTSARYFARDIVSIVVSCEDDSDVPPAPGTAAAGDTYENRPNVGVLSGASA